MSLDRRFAAECGEARSKFLENLTGLVRNARK